tara:strand:- start:1098 stop:1664 length:567 start_codon:yes stop_codon:yes gene_type:complete
MKQSDVTVIDNFLTKSYHEFIHRALTGPNFTWFFQDNISDVDNKSVTLGNYGFNHWVLNGGSQDSHLELLLTPLFCQVKDYLGKVEIFRARIDMTVFNASNHKHTPHVDCSGPHATAIYYVNDSDGETIIYDEKSTGKTFNYDKMKIKETIQPKANRIVIFDGSLYHTGHSPSKHSNRILINSNYAYL